MPANDEKASVLHPVTETEENLTLDRCLRNDPKTLTEEDLDSLIRHHRSERSRFIAAGDKKPRKGTPDDVEAAPGDSDVLEGNSTE